MTHTLDFDVNRSNGSFHAQTLGADAVVLGSGLLGQWQRRNREATIPHSIEQLYRAGNLDNFQAVIEGTQAAEYRGRYPFLDTDVYKTLEGVAYELARGGADESTRRFFNESIDFITRAQRPDGYLNTYFQAASIDKQPWTDLAWGHELYSLGHLIQAAVACNRQLQDRRLLDVSIRFANLVWDKFGPGGEQEICGHPEIEMALVELTRETGDRRYAELAELLVRRRGYGKISSTVFTSEYFQDQTPFTELESVTGHAVRMMYLASGATDVVSELGSEDLEKAVLRLWDDMVKSKLYITGGLGSRHSDEAIGDRFELPSERAYNETCAAIALMQWAWRMMLQTGEARFADVFEIVLYNAFAVGLSDDGKAFFYDNPLQRRTDHQQRSGYENDGPLLRRSWFGCPCCPPNIIRWISELQDHIAFTSDGTLYIANYSDATIEHAGHRLSVATQYPWDGEVTITVERTSTVELAIALRVPSWARSAEVTYDGAPVAMGQDGWVRIPGPAVEGATIRVKFETPVRPHGADPRVDAVRGSLSIMRGPVVYCAEQQDNEADIDGIVITPEQVRALEPVDSTLLPSGSSVVLTGVATAVPLASSELYPELGVDGGKEAAESRSTQLTLIPYFQWGNRDVGAMRVWLRTS